METRLLLAIPEMQGLPPQGCVKHFPEALPEMVVLVVLVERVEAEGRLGFLPMGQSPITPHVKPILEEQAAPLVAVMAETFAIQNVLLITM